MSELLAPRYSLRQVLYHDKSRKRYDYVHVTPIFDDGDVEGIHDDESKEGAKLVEGFFNVDVDKDCFRALEHFAAFIDALGYGGYYATLLIQDILNAYLTRNKYRPCDSDVHLAIFRRGTDPFRVFEIRGGGSRRHKVICSFKKGLSDASGDHWGEYQYLRQIHFWSSCHDISWRDFVNFLDSISFDMNFLGNVAGAVINAYEDARQKGDIKQFS